MKNLFLFIVALVACAVAQELTIDYPVYYDDLVNYPVLLHRGPGRVVTDSIVWRVTSVDNAGDSTCLHEWVESESHRAVSNGMSCCVYHNGFHCDWDDAIKSRICRLCLRKETLREQWYQHRAEPPKTEYDRLQEKLDNDKK